MMHWAWLLALAAVLAGGLAYLVSSMITPVYEASTLLLVNEAPSNKALDLSLVQTSERLAKTYAEMLTSRPILEEIIQKFSLDTTPVKLVQRITVLPVRDTQLIRLQVEDTDPQRAADIANEMVAIFSQKNQELQAERFQDSKTNLLVQLTEIEQQMQATSAALDALEKTDENQAERTRLEAVLTNFRSSYTSLMQSYEQVRLTEAQSISRLTQVETAVAPDRPIRPSKMLNTLLAAIVGLMIAVGAVFLVDALDDTLRSPEEVTRATDLPILGVIAEHTTEDGRPITLAEPRSPVAEAFRVLRTNIQFASVDDSLRTLLVVSSSPSEGKSTISLNLGIALAQNDNQVALIDADLRRPRQHKLMKLSNLKGMTQLFVQPKVFLDGNMQKSEVDNLWVMTSGGMPPNPAELLGSRRMQEILREVGEVVDITIVDSPPVLAVTDAAVLAPHMDGVLIVARPGQTKLAALKQSVSQLRRVGANILGVVLNQVEFERGSRYSYSYREYAYTYNSHYFESDKDKKNGNGRGESKFWLLASRSKKEKAPQAE
jgi:non-specific protein-tyrosine kinase